MVGKWGACMGNKSDLSYDFLFQKFGERRMTNLMIPRIDFAA